ncbi:MAG: thiamine pyrophosphate-binding protein [Kiloniellaceae bacterium]
MDRATPTPWPHDIHDALKAQAVRQVAYVPDAGHKELIDLCSADRAMDTVPLTTEEEGVALLAGAWLGGQRGVLLMQSSGIGNCVNMFSLTRTCRFPLLMLVTMRGQWAEYNPWQVPMGQIAGEVLRLTGALVFPVEDAREIGATVAAAARMAFDGPAAAAVLIGQRAVGIKTFGR